MSSNRVIVHASRTYRECNTVSSSDFEAPRIPFEILRLGGLVKASLIRLLASGVGSLHTGSHRSVFIPGTADSGVLVAHSLPTVWLDKR